VVWTLLPPIRDFIGWNIRETVIIGKLTLLTCSGKKMDYNRPYILKDWIKCLEDIQKEFTSPNVSIRTIMASLKSQLKELSKS
jgi:hypothetical protein